jgi:hypothetical protein
MIKIYPDSQSIVLFKVIELWHRWNRPADEYDFALDTKCDSGCIILELGFFGVTLLRGDCKVV